MQLRQKPKLSYSGLTVVLSNPSRLDKYNLLSCNGGIFFDACLRPDYNRFQCDIRIKEDKSPLLDGTRCILLLGEDAMNSWLGEKANGNSLGAFRGTLFRSNNGTPIICSFSPQDCVDFKDWEKMYNPLVKGDAVFEKDDDESVGSEKRRHGVTKRKNYGFWFDRDMMRVKEILKHGLNDRISTQVNYRIQPSSQEIIDELQTTKGGTLFLDYETNRNLDPLCLGYSFGLPKVSVFPFVNHRYEWAYSSLPHIVKALSIAFRDNTVIAFNGAGFDYFVSSLKLRIPINKVYDPMVAWHRCFPDAEKSLGHVMSVATWEPFHKDESSAGYGTAEQADQLMRYCGKDVFGLILIYDWIVKYAKTIPGLTESIQQANDAIKPYLITTLTGIQYDPKMVAEIMAENDRLMMQYMRIINLLIGDKTVRALRGKSTKAMPGSNNQCVYYFHELLGYDTVGYGKPTKKGTRNPSLSKTNIFKLRMKYNNPVLDYVIAFRELAKESGSLKFSPFVATDENENNNAESRDLCGTATK